MWYYVKQDKSKVGPVSDPTIVDLFKRGKVKPSTLVWSQHQNKWTEFKNTKFFAKITKRQKNYKFENYKYKTYLLRSLLWTLIVMFCIKGWFVYDFIQLEKSFAFDITKVSLQQEILLRESKLILSVFSILQILVVGAAFIVGAVWISSSIKAAKAVSSRIMISSKLSLFGCLAPIANIVLIPSIVKKIFYRLLISHKNPKNAISVIYFRTWTYVWFISWISLVVSQTAITSFSYPEIEVSLNWFKIYNYGLISVMLLGSTMVVQKIFKMIKSKYE